MANDDLIESIRGVVKDEIEVALEPVIRKLDGITDQLSDVSENVSEIKDKVKSHEKRISNIEDHSGMSTPID